MIYQIWNNCKRLGIRKRLAIGVQEAYYAGCVSNTWTARIRQNPVTIRQSSERTDTLKVRDNRLLNTACPPRQGSRVMFEFINNEVLWGPGALCWTHDYAFGVVTKWNSSSNTSSERIQFKFRSPPLPPQNEQPISTQHLKAPSICLTPGVGRGTGAILSDYVQKVGNA